jgi:DNA-directed RNA polymerase beta subunit
MDDDNNINDRILFDIIDKIKATSNARGYDAQVRGYNRIAEIGLESITRSHQQWYHCNVQEEKLYFFRINSIFVEKPKYTEPDNNIYPLTAEECRIRECTLLAIVYVSISIFLFSKKDPRKHKALFANHMNLYKQAKPKRVRISEFRQLDQKKRNNRKKQESQKSKDETSLAEEDTEMYSEEVVSSENNLSDEEYHILNQEKLKECHLHNQTYPFFVSELTYPHHPFFDLPVLTDSILDHGRQFTAFLNESMYISRAVFPLNGKNRTGYYPYNILPNHPFVTSKGVVTIRSSHPWWKCRSSTSNLQAIVLPPSKFTPSRMIWQIGNESDGEKLSWSTMFGALNQTDKQFILNYFWKEFQDAAYYKLHLLDQPDRAEKLRKIVVESLDFDRPETTQDNAWYEVGKLTRNLPDFHVDLKEMQTINPMDEDGVYINEKEEQEERLQFKLLSLRSKIASSSSSASLQFEEEKKEKSDASHAMEIDNDEEKKSGEEEKEECKEKEKETKSTTTSSPTPFVLSPEDERRLIIKTGRMSVLVKEVLPHVGCETRFDANDWLPKFFHLIQYSILALQSWDSENGMIDNQDEVGHRAYETYDDWLIKQVLRINIISHIKMARREAAQKIRKGLYPFPNLFLDKKRLSDAIHSNIVLGTSGMHSVLNNNNNNYSSYNNHANPHITNTRRMDRGGGGAAATHGKQSKDRNGLTQPENPNNINSLMSQITRLSNPTEKRNAPSHARHIFDDIFAIDVVKTPDSDGCGMVKSLTMYARFSNECYNNHILLEFVKKKFTILSIAQYLEVRREEVMIVNVENVSQRQSLSLPSYHHMFLNGSCIGIIKGREEADNLLSYVREYRYALFGDVFLSALLHYGTKHLYFYTHKNRPTRPLFVISKLKELFALSNSSRMFKPKNNSTTPLRTQLSLASLLHYYNLDWDMLLQEGFVHMIDKLEEDYDEKMVIVFRVKDALKLLSDLRQGVEGGTDVPPYCELHPCLIAGFVTGQIPFPNHNLMSKNVFGANMLEQAMSVPHLNSGLLLENGGQSHIQLNASLALVTTQTLNWNRCQDAAVGFMSTMATLIYDDGKGVEDAMRMNQGSIDRGMALAIQMNLISLSEKRSNNTMYSDIFQKCSEESTIGMKSGVTYDHVDMDGLPFPGTYLELDNIMVSRTSYLTDEEKEQLILKGEGSKNYRCTSILTPNKYVGEVMKVIVTRDLKAHNNGRKAKMVTRKLIPAVKGNKFNSTHGQKNVISPIREEDCPVSELGIRPDFIFNPHGLPSRMTIANEIEKISGVLAVDQGQLIDGTIFSDCWKECLHIAKRDWKLFQHMNVAEGNVPFEDFDLQDPDDEASILKQMQMALVRRGAKRNGYQDFYSGITGRKLGKRGSMERGSSNIFSYPLRMHVNIHRVENISSARRTGPKHILTRQPTESSVNHGFAMGDMEIQCAQVSGAAYTRLSKTRDESDLFVIHLCERCGNSSRCNFKTQTFLCAVCGSDGSVIKACITYGAKLLFQTLVNANLVPRYICKKNSV